MSEFGRNEPCFCGSGKKYKKCCHLKNYKPLTSKLAPQIEKYLGGTVKIKESSELGLEKLSKALFEIMGDYFHECNSTQEQLKLAQIAITAWNCSVKPEIDLTKALSSLFEGDDLNAAVELAHDLIERKKKLFPNDVKRLIKYCEIETDDKGGMYLDVIATYLEDETDKVQ